MKKLAVLILLIMTVFLFAQEVAEEEFLDSQAIEFTNYSGPYEHINTLEEIQGIGRNLAQVMDARESSRAQFGHFRMVHSFQPEIEQGLDGDILILLETSGVDHVRNLRHILAGYLEDQYGYEYERAYLLAEFITFYNAVHHQEIQHFQERFKPGVLEELTPDRCGLATIYSQWPGRARVVIPLRNPRGMEDSRIDTSIITEEEVIDQMREEEDQALDERKDMAELIEEEIQEEEQILEEEQQELEERQEVIEEELQELEEEEQTGELTEEQEERRDELQEELEEVQEDIQEVEEEQASLEERQEQNLDNRDQIARDENQQIQEGRDETPPSDQETTFREESEPGPVPVHFFHVDGLEEGIPYGQIFLYDLTSGEKTGESTVTTLYGREYTEYRGLFLAIGKERGTGRVLLMQIDRENLGLIATGSLEVYPGSRVEVDQSNRIYAVALLEGQWTLARFNSDLEVEIQSSQPVDPLTDILFYNGKIYVQSPQGYMLELNFQSLETEKEYR